jgi:hypothetical protein
MKLKNVIVALILGMLICLGIIAMSHASPFLVCDPQAGVTSYQLTGMPWVPTGNVAAQADGSVKYDVQGAIIGSNAISIKACKVDPLWGTVCSTATPFTFPRPDLSTGAPSNPKLAP